MFGRNSVRFQPSGPTTNMNTFGGPLRQVGFGGQPLKKQYADGGRVSAFDVIREELPKWWKSDETADLRKGLRQTALAPAYLAMPGVAALGMSVPSLYDAFARDEEEAKNDPTAGSFEWFERMLGRDLHDPIEEDMSLLSGLAQAAPIVRDTPKALRWLKKKFASSPESGDMLIDDFLRSRDKFSSDSGMPLFHATDAIFDTPNPGTWFTSDPSQIEAGRFGSRVKAYELPFDVPTIDAGSRGRGFADSLSSLSDRPVVRVSEEISGMDPSISYIVNDPTRLKPLKPRRYAEGGAVDAFLNL